jgi:hypothetical protein
VHERVRTERLDDGYFAKAIGLGVGCDLGVVRPERELD